MLIMSKNFYLLSLSPQNASSSRLFVHSGKFQYLSFLELLSYFTLVLKAGAKVSDFF